MIDWTAAYKEHTNTIRKICYEYEKSPALLEELVQDVWVRALEKQDQFNGNSSLGTWLHSIAETEGKMHVRRQVLESDTTILEADFLSGEEEGSMDDLMSDMDTPEEWAIAEQTARLIEDKETKTIMWAVLRMSVIDGMSTSEIAEHLEITESTVYVHLFKVRELIQVTLEKSQGK